jgi:hypothetical protein
MITPPTPEKPDMRPYAATLEGLGMIAESQLENPSQERPQRAPVAGQLRKISKLLGGLSSLDMARLLRNDGAVYPGDGLVRLMLAESQDPSRRFADLVAARLAEVESQLEAGVSAIMLAGRVREVAVIRPKRHVVTIATAKQLGAAALGDPEDWTPIVLAAIASVPGDWIGVCAVCGQEFIRRSSRMRVCRRVDDTGRFACVRESQRRQRAARREAAKAEGEHGEARQD